jgi:Domain of unknown function (DUF4395)
VTARIADPYRDLGVIDARAPRFNQVAIGSLALLAFLVHWWPLLAVLALQLAIGLRFGRRYCLPCLFYFEVIQPRFGEGPIEDARPPRFANMVGLGVLSAATAAFLLGLDPLGWALGLLVAGLALLAAVTGLCVGCELYKIGARLRGIYDHRLDEVDLADVGVERGSEVVVLFTHPLCTDCHDMERRLVEEGKPLATVDVKQRPDLARKYGIAVVPTAIAVGAGGAAVRIAG